MAGGRSYPSLPANHTQVAHLEPCPCIVFPRQYTSPPPPHPIAIRPERIAPRETELTVQTALEPWHALDYNVSYEGATVFKVRGRPWSLTQRRTFFDATGLPLFELRESWYNSSRLDLRLPGTRHSILNARLRVEIRAPRVEVTFKNAGSERGVDGPEIKLEVKDHDLDDMIHVVVLGDRNVAIIQRVTDSRELVEGQRLPFRFRPRWRATVAAGVDLLLIAVLVVIIGQRVAPNPDEGSDALEREV